MFYYNLVHCCSARPPLLPPWCKCTKFNLVDSMPSVQLVHFIFIILKFARVLFNIKVDCLVLQELLAHCQLWCLQCVQKCSCRVSSRPLNRFYCSQLYKPPSLQCTIILNSLQSRAPIAAPTLVHYIITFNIFVTILEASKSPLSAIQSSRFTPI